MQVISQRSKHASSTIPQEGGHHANSKQGGHLEERADEPVRQGIRPRAGRDHLKHVRRDVPSRRSNSSTSNGGGSNQDRGKIGDEAGEDVGEGEVDFVHELFATTVPFGQDLGGGCVGGREDGWGFGFGGGKGVCEVQID